MPTFQFTLAHDVSVYGHVEVEADSLAAAVEKVRSDLDGDQTYWEKVTDVDYSTSVNFRVVAADLVVDGNVDIYQPAAEGIQISEKDECIALTAEAVLAAITANTITK